MAILGIDEVGRGPLAGPLVMGAVILPEDKEKLEWVGALKDSKKLSAKRREELSSVIWAEAPAVGLGWVSAVELDNLGMTEALTLACQRAVKSVKRLHVSFSQIIIDGNTNFLELLSLGKYVTTLVKADNLIKEVSAASIVAKCARDEYMIKMAEECPGYGFERNMGYGTAEHLAALRERGLSVLHRKSFEPCKSMVGFSQEEPARKNTTLTGKRGEMAVSKYLEAQGHTVIMRNFKTKFCEIDVVSVCGDKIYFTEVKTRKDGSGVYAVDANKLQRMRFAVEVFLKCRKDLRYYDPLMAVASVNGDFEVLDWFTLDALDK